MSSPYSPPKAETRTENDDRGRRSFIVWLIVIVMGSSSLLSCISLSMPIFGWQVSNLDDRQFFSSLKALDWVLAFLPHLSIILSCYFLFRMKKQAVKLWFISIGLTLLSTGNIALKKDVPASGGELWLALIFSATMLLIIQAYILRISVKGRLT